MDYRTSVVQEFENFETELDFITTLQKKQRTIELDDVEIRAAAFSLSAIYNGIEKVLVYILRNRDNEKSDGPNWHAALLKRSSEANLISEETENELKGFMAFRHFVRHAYSFEIDANAIQSIIERCSTLVMRLKQEVLANIAEREPKTKGDI